MTIDKGFGADHMGIAASAPISESGIERTMLMVSKWDDEQTDWMHRKLGLPDHVTIPGYAFINHRVNPYEDFVYHGNLITRAGWTLFLHGKTILSTDTAPTLFFDSTHGRIGVGTSVSAAAATDTALGSIASMTGNNWILCAAAPTVTTTATPSTVVFTATFGATDAVGAWNEFAIDQGTAAAASVTATAPMLNHSTSIGAGTKAGGTWTATATLSFT